MITGIILATDDHLKDQMPYPSVLHRIYEGCSVIDIQIAQLLGGGINNILVITRPGNVGPIASYARSNWTDVTFQFETPTRHDEPNSAAALVRACRLASYKKDITKFVVLMPGAAFDDPSVAKTLAKSDVPTLAVFDRFGLAGRLGALFLDWETARRLKLLYERRIKEEVPSVIDLIEDDRAAGELYREVVFPGRYWNLADYAEIKQYGG